MNPKNFFLAFATVLMGVNAFGDGPPMDSDGKILEDHVVIVLNEAQLKQVGAFRVLVFTDEQHEYIKRISGNFPKRIWTVTPHYRLCTCERIYGIWNKIDQVGIPLKVLDNPYQHDQDFLENHNQLIESTLQAGGSPGFSFWKPLVKDKSWCGTLTIDQKGNMYSFGRIMATDDIERFISECPAAKGKADNTIFLSPPPSIDEEVDRKIHALIEHIRKYASEKDIEVEIGLSL